MLQIIQDVRRGDTSVVEVPAPLCGSGQVLIANRASLVSAGTERMVIELSRKSLLGKARERPDQVRRVLQKLRAEGLQNTLRSVRAKLDEPMKMGYASAGTVLAVGAGVSDLKVGDRVASNGPHASVVSVPRHLVARVPQGVSDEHAAFTVLGAIALQGWRLGRTSLGESVFVIGLGLVGQLAVALARAAGCRVLGTDPDPAKCELARRMGAEIAAPELNAARVESLTGGLGADAVLITASTKSNGPIELAAAAVRAKGRVVLVGVVGLELDRRPFYFKEAEFVVSCSYGPGRYDPAYEEQGHDYPAAHVRWTEQRNLQAVLDQMASGALDPSPLISHRFAVEDAERAYRMIEEQSEPYLGIVLQYPEIDESALTGRLRIPPVAGKRWLGGTDRPPVGPLPGGEGAGDRRASLGIGVLGAGNFARTTLLPAIFAADKRIRPAAIASGAGMTAADVARRMGFATATTDEATVLEDPDVEAVFIVTRHDVHARQTVAAISAGKHVWVEKPLCLDADELAEIEVALREAGESRPQVMVGFNRRYAEATQMVQNHFRGVDAPRTISFRFNAGAIPADHWTQDPKVGGGRIIGEACHGIDLATCLAGAPPIRVYAESIGGEKAPPITDDQVFITLRHANGSASNVAYLAGGDRALPKERVEIFGGGRAAVIDDWSSVTLVAGGKRKTHRLKADKGHRAAVTAFLQAVREGGEEPIAWEQIRSVSLASILAVQSLRDGLPVDFR